MPFLTPHAPGTNLKILSQGTVVGLPDGSTTRTTHSKNLLLPTLPPPATKGEIGPFQQCLISIPQLTCQNYKVSFDKEKATVYTPTGAPILTGPYCPRKNLFLLPIGKPTPQHSHQHPLTSANNVQISTLDTKQNLAIWYHRICFCPVITTWIKAINAGFFGTVGEGGPGLC